MQTRRAVGDDCLKDDDCLSGICSQLRCAAAPPTIDAQVVAEAAAGPSSDAAPDEASPEDASQGESNPDGASAEDANPGGESAGD